MSVICTEITAQCPVEATTYGYYPNLTGIFIGSDMGSFVLQAAGGGVVNGAGTNQAILEMGNNIIIVGIAFQVAAMSMFGFLALNFFIASRKHLREDFQGDAVTEKPQQKVWFILAAEIAAYITVLIRSFIGELFQFDLTHGAVTNSI